MKQIYQYRYYGTRNPKNQPANLDRRGLIYGTAFTDNGHVPILQLGIQALPGTQFYLNNSIEPITIGSTGIYELDLSGQSEITSVQFDYTAIDMIDDKDRGAGNAYLLIDIVYDGKGE